MAGQGRGGGAFVKKFCGPKRIMLGLSEIFLYPPTVWICDIKRMVEPWRIELQTFALRTRMGGKFFTGLGGFSITDTVIDHLEHL
jgi:hypothetical protein